MAVPARVDNRMSSGCLKLIREGAILVRNADDILLSIRAGTAITVRPRSAAIPVVIRVPLRSGASTATTPRASAATTWLRIGNVSRSGGRPNGNSLTTAPPFATIFRASSRFSSG